MAGNSSKVDFLLYRLTETNVGQADRGNADIGEAYTVVEENLFDKKAADA
jgi:hypothetical protein